MAYPKITDEQYQAAFERLCQDNHPEKITSNQLQLTAGGRYSNAAKALERFLAEYRKRQRDQALVPVQPSWFREYVASSIGTFRDQIESQWSVIGVNIEERILEATSKLEADRDQLKNKYEEDRSQIELLENETEELSQQLVDRDVHVNQLLESLQQERTLSDNQVQMLEKKSALINSKDEQLDAQKATTYAVEIKLDNTRTERDTLKGQFSQLQGDFKAESEQHRQEVRILSEKLRLATDELLLQEKENQNRKAESLELRKQLDQAEKDERQALLDNQALTTTLEIRMQELQDWKDSQLATAKALEASQKELRVLKKKQNGTETMAKSPTTHTK